MWWLKSLPQHRSKWPQIAYCIGLNYEAHFSGPHNAAVKPIWTLFTAGQTAIPYVQSMRNLLHPRTGIVQWADYRNHSFPFSSSPFPSPRGTGVCGTTTRAHKDKWVPCVWWRGEVTVTRYGGGRNSHESIFNSGRGDAVVACTATALSPRHFIMLSCPVSKSDQQMPVISTWRSVERGPLLPGLSLCFGLLRLCCIVTLLGGQRGLSFYCFQSISAISQS